MILNGLLYSSCHPGLCPEAIRVLMAAAGPEDKERMHTHIAGQDFHCGVMEFISSGLDIATVKQVPGI